MMRRSYTAWDCVALLPIVGKAVQQGYVSSYTANALNQYKGRTVPGYAGVRGSVNQDASVAVNGAMAWQLGNYFYGGDDADNSTSAVMKELEIIAAYSNLYSAATGSVFVAESPEEFTYDDDGNLIQDGRWQYTWNGENRLIKAETRNDLPLTVPRITVEYAYDHQGRMVWKQITENNSPTKAITYLWDDYNIISETIQNQQSTIINHYVWGLDLSGSLQGAGGVGGLLAVVNDSESFTTAYDGNGNITEYISNDGTTVAHYEYSPFGEIVVQSGELASTFTYRFSTKPWCSITGLSEYELRKYRPNIGRWMSRDPIGEQGGLFLYGFVGNNALNRSDYLGMEFWDWVPIASWLRTWIQGAPGQDPSEYSGCVTARLCCEKGTIIAEIECKEFNNEMFNNYKKDLNREALIARAVDTIGIIIGTFSNPYIAAGLAVDTIIGAGTNFDARYKMLKARDEANKNNCDCGIYGYF